MLRRRCFWILLLLAIILVWGLFAIWSYHSSQSFLNQAIAETDALDPRWRLADMLADRKSIPDDQNSALVIMAGHRHLNNIDRAKRDKVEEASEQDLESQNHCYNEQQKDALRQLVDMHADALVEYRKIAAMPAGHYPFVWNPMAQGSQSTESFARSAMYALRYDLRHCLAHGDFDKADQRMLGIVNIAPSLGDEPATITLIIRSAIIRMAGFAIEEWLAKSQPNEAVLGQIQSNLETQSSYPFATVFVEAERASGFESYDNMAVLTPPPANPWQAIQFCAANAFGNVGFVRQQKAHHLITMNKLIEITKQPSDQQLGLIASCEQYIPERALVRLSISSFEKMITSLNRSHAHQLCTITALAAERFRIQHTRWPNALDELVTAGLIKSVPLDPFDGQPLRWKPTENGRLIYSIGQDRVDNNGAYDPEKSTDPGNDIIFRLYDPAQRRLPPLPPKPKAEEPKDQ